MRIETTPTDPPYLCCHVKWGGPTYRLGCSHECPFPPEFNLDYGQPVGLCSETAPGMDAFRLGGTKANVEMDCNVFKGTIDMI